MCIETLDGDINIGNVDIQDITITTNNGNIAFGSATINHLQINTLDGNISFDNTAIMQELACETKNGNVIGTFSGNMADYSIVTETVGGNSNLNSKVGGDKTISISTQDGDIDISFDK